MACASRRPARPLDAFIETLWTSERATAAAHAREWNLPTGRADLVVPLTQGALHRFAGRGDAAGCWFAGGVLQGGGARPCQRCATPRRRWPSSARNSGRADWQASSSCQRMN
jgi:hypothetical protein